MKINTENNSNFPKTCECLPDVSASTGLDRKLLKIRAPNFGPLNQRSAKFRLEGGGGSINTNISFVAYEGLCLLQFRGRILNKYSCSINEVAQLVETMRSKPKSRAFDSQ